MSFDFSKDIWGEAVPPKPSRPRAPKKPAVPKEPGAFLTIGELAKELDLEQYVLRYWESKFPQIQPLKRAGGRRYYRSEDVELIRKIQKMLYRDGFTIRGAQKALQDKKTLEPVLEIKPTPVPKLDRQTVQVPKAEMKKLLDELHSMRRLLQS